jgi:hypothetical protein
MKYREAENCSVIFDTNSEQVRFLSDQEALWRDEERREEER